MLKILKYDWKNGWNSVKWTLLAAAVISILAGLFFGRLGGQPVITETGFGVFGEEAMDRVTVVLSMVWFSVMMALLVLTIVTIFDNMSKRMFGPEGYLTHTLPVETWELLGGKVLGTWLFGVFMVGVAIVSVLLVMAFTAAGYGSLLNTLEAIIDALPKLGPEHYRDIMSGVKVILFGIAAFLAWSLVLVVQFQFICIAARLFGKHYIAGGVIVFWMLLALEGNINRALSAGFLVSLVFAAACFWGSGWILKNRLSL